MFYYKFFCQTIQCPKKEGGHNVPTSDVSPTKKHADVTRVKTFLIPRGIIPENFSLLGFAVSEELGNKQTIPQTYSLTDRLALL